MKKIITLALAAGMMAAAAAPASAADIKVDGSYTFQFIQRSADYKAHKEDLATQQVKLGLTATVSENLSAYFQTYSYWDWGTNDYYNGNTANGGTAFDGAKISVKLYQAYVDWIIPNTTVKVRMGRQSIALPGLANGKNPALWWKDPVDGITVSSPVTDYLDVAAFWARYDREDGTINVRDTAQSDSLDAFGLAANVKFDGVKVSPFIAYANIGEDIPAGAVKMNTPKGPAGSGNIFWAGFSSQLTMFDPIVAKLGFVYGDRNYAAKEDTPSQHGWLVDASVAYKTPYGTPELFGWYGSGDDKDVQYVAQNHLPAIGGRFNGSYGFYNGSKMNENELGNCHTGAGAWGIRLGMTGISFLEGLTHDVAVLYAQGTNDARNAGISAGKPAVHKYMTTKDSIVEFDFGTTYQIYKNLAARLEAAYVIENFDDNLKQRRGYVSGKFDNAWKVALQLQYKF